MSSVNASNLLELPAFSPFLCSSFKSLPRGLKKNWMVLQLIHTFENIWQKAKHFNLFVANLFQNVTSQVTSYFHIIKINFLQPTNAMGECNTILSAYTKYEDLG